MTKTLRFQALALVASMGLCAALISGCNPEEPAKTTAPAPTAGRCPSPHRRPSRTRRPPVSLTPHQGRQDKK